jgi:hypothetical protein
MYAGQGLLSESVVSTDGRIRSRRRRHALEAGPGVVYTSTTRLDGLGRSGFTGLVGKPAYREMTISYGTAAKRLALMKARPH